MIVTKDMEEPTTQQSPNPEQQPESPVPPKRPWLTWLGTGLIVLLVGSYLYELGTKGDVVTESNQAPFTTTTRLSTPTGSSTIPSSVNQATAPRKTVLESGGWQVTSQSSFSCRADLPNGWTIESRRESDLARVINTDQSMYAGYAINSVNPSLQPYAGVYQPPANNPDLYSSDPATVAKAYAHLIIAGGQDVLPADASGVAFTSDFQETVGDYQLRSIASASYRGILVYHSQGFPAGDGYSYILPMRFALTRADLWEVNGLQVARLATSINCTTQLVARDSWSVGDLPSSSNRGTNRDDGVSEEGYNPQLGTEYVHDANGNNYVVSPSESWSATGPDGPGYYVPTSGGNFTEKLQPGRVD